MIASRERSTVASTWRIALRQASFIVVIAMALGLVFNQFRSNSLPLFGEWSPEARLTLRFGKNILIPFDEAKEKFFAGNAFFIDARPEDAYRKGHIQGSRSLPFEAFDQLADEVLIDLPEDTLVITYCDGERCTLSAEVALKLKEIGFENVRVLFNGWTVWKDHHLPTQIEDARQRE
jgi:rhodanese-related sulfurtransferase